MSDAEKEIERLRAERAAIAAEIRSRGSEDIRLLMDYIDAKHDEMKAEIKSDIKDVTRAYEMIKGVPTVIKWIVGIGASIAVIWGAIKGVKV
ncbi:MAG: hypothetical protein H5T98_00970 [Syntrophomonadaceae bacterium]|nr:hypothetical protein [Syntrophomonadaceae bacterium]